MSLLELIADADERGLAASGLACLDRCLPPTEDGSDPEPLRPLWASCETGAEWAGRLDAVHAELERAGAGGAVTGGTTVRVVALLGAAPRGFEAGPLRAWADACSLLALDIHGRFDFPSATDAEALNRCREGGAADGGPLVMGELRRQAEILEILAGTAETAGGGASGLRRVLDLSVEGRRVLRAVMSRHARGRARPGGAS
ncbi:MULTISPECIES: hypothetical protein [unclassified Streptomyces]|uniref:hypothetical protein n=1 Tax=unclassified Streptomyces TaxID=2593676 RepID=UPI00093B09CC|nr:hypothetical protein [Streptomyces sp. CB02058]OKI98623.1 hypothetical protein AMK10_02935 [Streptomyces sp. CB02058]